MSQKTLREKQALFHRCIAKLILEAYKLGIEVYINELYRSLERQKQLYQEGKTRTLNSMHLYGLACDIYVLKNGKPVLEETEEYIRLGQIWKSWGGRWGGDFKTLKDFVHFEYSDNLKFPE
jgi:peptidoglycan L-alanyl-D-glutamate endopeptidase CwlK